MTRRLKTFRPLILPAILLAAIAILLEVLQNLGPFDTAIINTVRTLPGWFSPIMTLFTTIGSTPFIIAIVVIWAALELRHRQPRRALIMVLSTLVVPVYYIMKVLVHRARPLTDYVHSHGLSDFSFPSGHSAASAAVYGTIAVLAAGLVPKPWNRLVVAVSLLIAFGVGLSRVYLGAHFPSDVLGGWLLALIFVSALRSVSIALAKQAGQVRSPADTTEDTQPEAPAPQK